MNYHSQSVVFILTTDLGTKQVFREISSRFPTNMFKIISSPEEIKNGKDIKIIFLEKKYSQTDSTCLKTVTLIRKNLSQNIPVILISYECSFSKLKTYLSNGLDSVLYKPLNKSLVEALILKYTLKLKDSEVFYEYHNIKLYPNLKIAYYNECKIFLTDIETSILSTLLPKESNDIFCPLKTLKTSVKNELNFTLSDTYLRVTISRLRSKFQKVSNLNIIKNKYRRGYYISI